MGIIKMCATSPKRRTFFAVRPFEVIALVVILAIGTLVLVPGLSNAGATQGRTMCLNNERQLGQAIRQYMQDNDDHMPVVHMPTSPVTWTYAITPYLTNRAALRCAEDASDDWTNPYDPSESQVLTPAGGQDEYRASSYFLNLWLSGTSKYGSSFGVRSPSKVIMLTESAEDLTRDHFHPMYWNKQDPETKHTQGFDPMMYSTVWDTSTSAPEEIAVKRHSGGFDSLYMDGHVRWAKWQDVWFQAPGVYDGAFDPRQP